MNTKQTEALKLALEALELHGKQYPHMVKGYCLDAITAIREALVEQPAQPEQCECPACKVTPHASDCAVHNEPAYPKGACDCGAQPYPDNFIDALKYDVAKRDSEAQQAYEDAFINGTGVMIGDKRIDPASIYKEPEQEPVAWMHPDGRVWTFGRGLDKSTFTIPLYTSPPASKPWVGLTDEEMIDCERLADIRHRKHMGSIRGQQLSPADQFLWHYARAIEAKLREKNA